MADVTSTALSLFPESPFRTAVILLIVSAIVLTVIKPDFMYNDKDEFRAFGTGPHQTLMPFWMAVTLVGVVGYYLAFAIAD